MTTVSINLSVLFSALLTGVLGAPSLCGQGLPTAGQKATNAAPLLPPPPPLPINFRQLLAMSAGERETILATRSPEQRRTLQTKLREYEALPPTQRESRLCTLQLRLYLRPLMETPLSNRLERVATVPQPDRRLVEKRLQIWDELPAEVQREWLTNEMVLRYLFRPEPPMPGPSGPELKPQEILDKINQLLESSEKAKSKVLHEFNESERQRMQRALKTFERLSKPQRERCVNGFQKFAGLSESERQQFLSNVDYWQSMSATDRQAWQALIYRMSSPKPPGLPAPPPPKLPSTPSSRLTATN